MTKLAFGKRVRELRHERGWSMARLAMLLAVAESTICRIELGKLHPRADMIERMAATLGVAVGELFGREDHRVKTTA